MRIAVEGAIGVGKTTLCKALVNHISDSVLIPEPVTENPYLADYYADSPRWALAMQTDILIRRANAIASMAYRKRAVELLDRSAWGDRLFAITARDMGIMSGREFNTYDSVFRAVTATPGTLPDAIFYLRASPDTIWERVKSRARPEEESMRQDYLYAVCKTYDAFFMHPPIGLRVVTIDWDTFGDVASVWSKMETAFIRGFV